MNGKLTLSFSVATFIAAIGVMFFLSDVRGRLARVESQLAETPPVAPPPTNGSLPPSTEESEAGAENGFEEGVEPGPLDVLDPIVKLDWLINKIDEIDTRLYEGLVDLESELYQVKDRVGKTHLVMRRMLDGLRHTGDFPGLASTLPEPKKPLSVEQAKTYKDEAVRFGMKVEEGRVTARGLLNGSQDRAYPIEYFMTRFPDAGHETLVHLMGAAKMEDFAEPPFPSLQGLPTALYKALLAAGFEQGEGTHPSKIPPDEDTTWILATGDTVYMYVAWEEDGEKKLARASDWILDPATGTTLPEDCFKFTGSVRVEDRETGDEMLLAEGRGFLVSVYPDRAAMVEVALDSAARNNYGYNWSRLPKHDGSKPFYVDVIFSKTPLKK